MALSELAVLVAVGLGVGAPLFRYYVASRDDRRRSGAERFAHACREAGFVLVPDDGTAREGESTWRGRSLSARRRVADGTVEVEVSVQLEAPLHLGLELTTSGPLPAAPEGSRARSLPVPNLPRAAARAVDVDRASEILRYVSTCLPGILNEGYVLTMDDDVVRLHCTRAFVRADLARMSGTLLELRSEVRRARSRVGIADVDDDLAVAWAAFASKRGLTMSAGPTLSGVLAQVAFEASIQFDRITGTRTTDVVLLEANVDGHMFSFVAQDRGDRGSNADASGETGDASLDRRFRLLVSNASGRARLEDARLRSLLVGLPPAVGTVHLASLGLRLGAPAALDGEEIEEIVRHGDEVMRFLVGRATEARAPYR